MTGIDSYSPTPATNATADGGAINWAEGQPPSSVNNTARQMLADTRSSYNDLVWFQYGTGDQGAGNIAVPSVYLSATSFTITGADVTLVYTTGRRVRAVGVLTGTIYGTIASSSYNGGNTKTTVIVAWDNAGSLSNEALVISLSQVPVTGNPASLGRVLLSSQSAAVSASLIFTLPSGYRRYEIQIDDLVISSGGADIRFQTSQNGGSAFQTASYLYATQGIDAVSAARATYNSTSAAGIVVAGSAQSSSTSPINVERITLHNPAATSVKQIDVSNASFVDNASSDAVQGVTGGGRYFGDTNAYNAFRIIPTAGTLTSGQVTLYGIP